MGILSKLLGNKDEKEAVKKTTIKPVAKKKSAPKKISLKKTAKKTSIKKAKVAKSATKKIPASVKDKYFITDITPTDRANTKATAKKKQVRLNIYTKVQKAIENAQKSIPESKLGRLEKIFTIDESGKTIATIRYGTIIFYQGRMEEANVFDRHGKENFKNKLGALNHLKIMLEADDWFDPQYEKYLEIKETADKRSAATKKSNKSKVVKATATKASAKKSTTKKSSAKKVVAKASSKKTTAKKTSTKAKSKK